MSGGGRIFGEDGESGGKETGEGVSADNCLGERANFHPQLITSRV